MFFDRHNHHLALRATCDACCGPVFPNEQIRALISNYDSTACEGCTRSVPFPPLGIRPPTQGYMLCRKPGCSICKRSPEAFTLHNECMQLFWKRCKSFSSLWTRAAWRNPWRGASAIEFHSADPPLYLESFAEVATRFGLPPWLSKLPLEIIEMIQGFSSSALLWKYVAVCGLADYICASQSEHSMRQPLNQIYQWERGGPISTKCYDSTLPVVRLGIDSRGIKTLRRFTMDQPLDNKKEGCCEFVVEREEDVRNVIAEFKDGLLRLILPTSTCELRIWDTPCPPALESCHFVPSQFAVPQRLRTVDLNLVTGLTFLCKRGRIYGIHGHTSEMPSALSEYLKLNERLRDSVVWVYFPLTRQERIQAVGVSGSFGLVIQTITGRVQCIGPWISNARAEDVIVSRGLPSVLLYENSDACQPISTIGTSSNSLTREMVRLEPRSCPISQGDMYYSSASLECVRDVRIFYNRDTCYCMGILFIYNDGTYQAVGQCGLGVFPEETIRSPLVLYHQSENGTHGTAVKVKFATKATQTLDWFGWKDDQMLGNITFWYNHLSLVLLERNS